MRESHAQAQIPAKGIDNPPYPDSYQLAQGYLKHVGESYIAQGVGAGGVGFNITNVPFEPAMIIALNPAGAAPATHHSVFSPTPAHTTTILAVAANGTPPTLTKVADNDWTVGIPAGMAPDTEVLTLLIFGVRDIAGGL